MGISDDTKMVFQNGSTIENLEAEDRIIRSSNKTFPFVLEMCLPRCTDKHDIIHDLINETIKGKIDMENTTKEIKTKNILELWEDKQASYIRQQYQEIGNNLHKDDSLYKRVYDLVLQIATEIAKEDPSVIEKQYKTFDKVATVILGKIEKSFCLHTKDTMDKFNIETTKYVSAKEKLNSDFHEIKAMLSACDTYEQEMAVLKDYGVVRANGKLNVPTV